MAGWAAFFALMSVLDGPGPLLDMATAFVIISAPRAHSEYDAITTRIQRNYDANTTRTRRSLWPYARQTCRGTPPNGGSTLTPSRALAGEAESGALALRHERLPAASLAQAVG